MQTAQHAAAASGTLVLDRYALVEELGSGGFGTVWLAHDERLERPVALKRIPTKGATPAAVARAEREALAAARLSHPAVVSLYESGSDGDAIYLVSELVRGATLGELLAEGALSDRDVVLVGLALCDGLAHAHARGIVHRDVKPGNVLVPDSGGEGVAAKLTDFGIARMAGDDALTATGDVVGTLAYMAPEQAEGRGTSPASDLYSAGLVLYEALAGVNPVRQSTPAATARAVGRPLPPLRRMRRDLPRLLTDAIDTAVQTAAEDRGTLEDLRASLLTALPHVGDEPGTVEAPRAWATETVSRAVSITQPWRRRVPAASAPAPPEPEEAVALPRRGAVAIPGRLASGVLTGALALAALSLVPERPPVDPALAAAIGGALTALLPRIGWLATAAAVIGWLAARDTDAAALLAVAVAPVPPLLIFRPAWWSAPGLAVGLGYVLVPGAWPALAGHARGPLTRAVLGAAGYWWLAVVETLTAHPLIGAGSGDLAALLRRPDLAIAAVWAAAAMAMPWLVRGRNLGADLLGALVWAAGGAIGAAAAAGALGSPDPRGLVGGAALGVVVAVLGRAATP